MEIDDLKKKWNKLNDSLQGKEVITDEEVMRVIQKKRDHVNSIMNTMKRNNRQMWLITVALYVIIITIRLIHASFFNELFFWTMIAFAIPALAWSSFTMTYLNKTEIDEMPLTTVIERVNRYKYWMTMERIVGTLFLFGFALLFGVTTEIWNRSTSQLVVFIGIWTMGFVVYFWVVNKYTFRRLKEVRRNLGELKEIS